METPAYLKPLTKPAGQNLSYLACTVLRPYLVAMNRILNLVGVRLCSQRVASAPSPRAVVSVCSNLWMWTFSWGTGHALQAEVAARAEAEAQGRMRLETSVVEKLSKMQQGGTIVPVVPGTARHQVGPWSAQCLACAASITGMRALCMGAK
jgi:hypothetical protein